MPTIGERFVLTKPLFVFETSEWASAGTEVGYSHQEHVPDVPDGPEITYNVYVIVDGQHKGKTLRVTPDSEVEQSLGVEERLRRKLDLASVEVIALSFEETRVEGEGDESIVYDATSAEEGDLVVYDVYSADVTLTFGEGDDSVVITVEGLSGSYRKPFGFLLSGEPTEKLQKEVYGAGIDRLWVSSFWVRVDKAIEEAIEEKPLP